MQADCPRSKVAGIWAVLRGRDERRRRLNHPEPDQLGRQRRGGVPGLDHEDHLAGPRARVVSVAGLVGTYEVGADAADDDQDHHQRDERSSPAAPPAPRRVDSVVVPEAPEESGMLILAGPVRPAGVRRLGVVVVPVDQRIRVTPPAVRPARAGLARWLIARKERLCALAVLPCALKLLPAGILLPARVLLCAGILPCAAGGLGPPRIGGRSAAVPSLRGRHLRRRLPTAAAQGVLAEIAAGER